MEVVTVQEGGEGLAEAWPQGMESVDGGIGLKVQSKFNKVCSCQPLNLWARLVDLACADDCF